MANAKNKTQLTDASVDEFLDSISDERQQSDSRRVLVIMRNATGEEAKMWGPAIVGFGMRHLKYESGREMDWMILGFSPRKGKITFYVHSGSPNESKFLEKLGKYKISGSCLHINKLTDINEKVFTELITDSYGFIKNTS
ncbi:MAG: DUF1801 domain-containing protein [Acidobacteriota bacterium]